METRISMFEKINPILQQQNIFTHRNQGISIATVKTEEHGIDAAKSILDEIIDSKTVFYLSGGKTPKKLYEKLAREEHIIPASVGQVDERYGQPYHQMSNEKMIQETGLLRYLQMRDIRFYPILKLDKSREEVAAEYDYLLRSQNNIFPKSIALLGIGQDGHTAGVAGNRKDFTNPIFDPSQKNLLVSDFNDSNGMFKERVTMTFLGLSMLDILLVLVLGEDKKQALEHMFSEGSEEQVPARFYKRPEIAKRTLLITDQNFN